MILLLRAMAVLGVLSGLFSCERIETGNPYDPASSAEDQAKGTVGGRLMLPAGFDESVFVDAVVELRNLSATGEQSAVSPVAHDGTFVFADVKSGSYEARPGVVGLIALSPVLLQLGIGQSVTLDPIELVADASVETRANIRGVAFRQNALSDGHGGIVVRFRGRPGATVTAADGTYEQDVPAGLYTIVFETPGYGTQQLGDIRAPAGVVTEVPPVELVGRPGLVRGTLVAPNGFAWSSFREDVVVEIWSTTGEGGAVEPESTSQPDANGDFEFTVRADTWKLVAHKPGFDELVWPRVSVEPGESVDVGLGRFDLPSTTTESRLPVVTGSALRDPLPAGEDHAGTWVEVPGTPFATVTDSDGRYLVNVEIGVPPVLRFRHTAYSPETLSLPAPLAAGEVLEADTVTLQAGLGTIRGRVAFPEGFVEPPVERVDVILSPLDGDGDGDGQRLPAVHPDLQGDFIIRDVFPGRWRLDLEVAGFATAPIPFIPVGVGETVNVGTATFDQLADDRGAAYVEGDVTLLGVHDPGGHGGILVEVRGTPFTALTNRAGHYRVEVVPELPVGLIVTRDGYDPGGTDLAGVGSGETFRAETIELAPRDGSIRGAVMLVGVNDPALYPLVSVQRRAAGAAAGSPPADQVAPDVEGRFVFAPTPVGRWQINASLAGFIASPGLEVEVTAGDAVDTAPILLTLPAGDPEEPGAPGIPTVSGRIQLTGAVEPDGHGGILVEVIGTPLATLSTSEGRFQIPVLPAPARPTLRFRKDGYGLETVDLEPQAPGGHLDLAADVVLSALPGRITGTVRLAHFGDALRLQAVDVDVAVGGRVVQRTRPDANGNFVLPDIPAGAHVVSVALTGFDRAVRNVEVEPGRALELGEVLLSHQSDGDAAVAIEGTVTLAGRAEHGGTHVQVRLVDGDLPFRDAVTRVDGRFTVQASRDERYRLWFDYPGFSGPPAGLGPVAWVPARARFEDDSGHPPELQLIAAPLAGRVTVPIEFGPAWIPGRELLAARVELTGPDYRQVMDGVTALSPAIFDVPRAGTYVARATRSGFVDLDVDPVVITADEPLATSEVIRLNLQRLAEADLDLSVIDACDLRNGVDARNAVLDAVRFIGDFGSAEARCGPVLSTGAIDLSRSSLVGADLRAARFATSRGEQVVDLREALMRDVDATGVDFRNADMTGADLRGANFSRTTLSGVLFNGARMGEIDLSDALMGVPQRAVDGTVMREPVGSPWEGQIASEGDLLAPACLAERAGGVSFRDADLAEANLSGAFLAGVDLNGASMPRAEFVATDLRGACLQDARLDGGNLLESLLDGADARRASFAQARLERTRLRGAWLDEARFGGAQVEGADFTEFPLADCSEPMPWADYDAICGDDPNADARCRCATRLRGAALDGSVFLGTALRGVDATGASGNGWTLGPGIVIGPVRPPLCTPEAFYECWALAGADAACGLFLNGNPQAYDEFCSFGNPYVPFSVLSVWGSRTPEEARERIRCFLRGRAAGAGCNLGPCQGASPSTAFGGDDDSPFGGCTWSAVEGMYSGSIEPGTACQLDGEAAVDPDCKPTTSISKSRFDRADLPFLELDRGYIGDSRFSGANLTGLTLIDDLLYASDPDVRWRGVDLTGATLTRAVFSRVAIGGLTLTDADLTGAVLQHSLFQGIAWRPALSGGATVVDSYLMCMSGFDCSPRGTVDVFDSVVEAGVIIARNISGGVYRSAGAATFAAISGTNVGTAEVTATSATSATLTAQRVTVPQVSESSVNAQQVTIGRVERSTVIGATWSAAPVTALSSRLDRSNFSQKCATGRDYSHSSFKSANFSGSKVSRTLFRWTDLTNADFTDACGISERPMAFEGATVQGTRFCADERAAFENGNRVIGTPQWVACAAGRTCQANCP